MSENDANNKLVCVCGIHNDHYVSDPICSPRLLDEEIQQNQRTFLLDRSPKHHCCLLFLCVVGLFMSLVIPAEFCAMKRFHRLLKRGKTLSPAVFKQCHVLSKPCKGSLAWLYACLHRSPRHLCGEGQLSNSTCTCWQQPHVLCPACQKH